LPKIREIGQDFLLAETFIPYRKNCSLFAIVSVEMMVYTVDMGLSYIIKIV
jgi:hypothetical protein